MKDIFIMYWSVSWMSVLFSIIKLVLLISLLQTTCMHTSKWSNILHRKFAHLLHCKYISGSTRYMVVGHHPKVELMSTKPAVHHLRKKLQGGWDSQTWYREVFYHGIHFTSALASVLQPIHSLLMCTSLLPPIPNTQRQLLSSFATLLINNPSASHRLVYYLWLLLALGLSCGKGKQYIGTCCASVIRPCALITTSREYCDR